MREGERFIDAKITVPSETGFSGVYLTTDSRYLSIEFGLSLGQLPSTTALVRIELARLFKIGSMETNKVVNLFTTVAERRSRSR